MTERFYEKERQQRKEAYLMASRDPWLVWRAQALKAGYVPPLLHGHIPPELAEIPLGPQNKDYHIEPLLQHADRVKVRERHFVVRMFIAFMLGLLIFCGVSFALAITQGSKFRIGLVESLMPKMEQSHTPKMQQ